MKYRGTILVLCMFFAGMAVFPARAEEVLTWQDCIREAAKNHPDLIVAAAGIKQNEAAKKISASGEYPQVNASAGVSTSKESSAKSSKSYSAGVSGNQLVFDGKKTINSVKAADADVAAARQNYRYTSSGVRQSLRTAFVGLLKAQEMTRISGEIYDIRRGNLELIALRYQSGLEHHGALLTAEANLANAKYGVSQAQRNLVVTQRELAKAMGREKWDSLAVRGDFKVRDGAQGDIDLTALREKNPRVQKAIAQKNASEFNLRSTYGNFAPSVSVGGSAQETGGSFPPEQGKVSAGVTVTLPIFEGGLRTAQVSQAKAQLDQQEASLRGTRDSVLLTLEQTRAILQDAVDNEQVQQKSLQATEERSKIAEAQYSIGTISYDNWSIIEDNLVSAKSSYLNAQANTLLAEANWIQAKGETLEYEE